MTELFIFVRPVVNGSLEPVPVSTCCILKKWRPYLSGVVGTLSLP